MLSKSSSSGMFGTDETIIDHPMPLDLKNASTDSDGWNLSEVNDVVCGAGGTAFLTEDGRCFVMGGNKNGELG